MKKVKVVSAVVVCICLIASIFAGCSKISLEGKWKATIDFTEKFSEGCDMSENAEMGKYYEKFSTPMFIDLIYTFDSDNSYTVAVDEEKLRADFDTAIEIVVDYMLEGMYKYAEDNGMTREELDSNFKADKGVSAREDLSAEVEKDVSTIYDDLIKELTVTETQHLYIKNDRFYNTDENGNELGYEPFTLEGDTLTIEGRFDMEDKPVEEEGYPIVLTKMN